MRTTTRITESSWVGIFSVRGFIEGKRKKQDKKAFQTKGCSAVKLSLEFFNFPANRCEDESLRGAAEKSEQPATGNHSLERT